MEKAQGIQREFIGSAAALSIVGISLPAVPPQTDFWSCGPNSATRLLRFYGHSVTYPQLKQVTARYLVTTALGTPPRVLFQVLRQWAGNRVRLQQRTSLTQLFRILDRGQPAIALVRVGQTDVSRLHWITVTGYDPRRQVIFYTDTDDRAYSSSYSQFQRQWGLQVQSAPLWSILQANGVQPNTIMWIEP